MKVRNRRFLWKLGAKNLKEKNRRTQVTILAIALTCVLFTSLFSVLFGLIKSMEFQQMRMLGGTSHGSFKDLSTEDIEILSKDPEVRESSVRTLVGLMKKGKHYAEVSYQDNKGMDWSILEDLEGRYPKAKDEVFMDRDTLKALGYKGVLGEKITLPYDVMEVKRDKVLESRKDTFTLVGSYKSTIDSNVGIGQIYLSKEFVDTLKIGKKSSELSIKLPNTWKIREQLTKIGKRNGYTIVEDLQDLDKEKQIRIGVSWAYFSNDENFDVLAFLLPGFLLLSIVFLAGYLLIHTIFQISIIEDTNLYGLLKTIGMTQKQIKKMVYIQGLFLSLPAIVMGNVLGIFLGSKILSRVVSTTNFLLHVNVQDKILPLILPFSAFFSLVTVFASCKKPAKLAAKISPIDAVRYQESLSRKKVNSQTFSLRKLAFRQVLGNKLRFLSIVLSISLSAVILNAVLTYTSSIDLEKGLSSNIRSDYNLARPDYFRYRYYSSDLFLDKEYIDELKEKEGFIEGGAIYSYGSTHTYPKVKIQGLKKSPFFFGMDDFLVKKQNFTQGEYNEKKWEMASYALVGEFEETGQKSALKVGDKVDLSYNGKKIQVEILGKIKYDFSNGLRHSILVSEEGDNWEEGMIALEDEYIYLHPKKYQELTGDESVMSYAFDVEESQRKTFDSYLKSLERNDDFSFDSRQKQVDSFKNFKNTVEFVGYSVSTILFFIGLVNFVNIIATDILRNRASLAIIEALGMTQKEIKSYLMLKSSIYSLSAFILSISLGIFLGEMLLKGMLNSMAWTNYSMKILPLILVNLVNLGLGIFFSSYFYSKLAKSGLSGRIRGIMD